MPTIKPGAILVPPSLAVDNRDELNEVFHALDHQYEAVHLEWVRQRAEQTAAKRVWRRFFRKQGRRAGISATNDSTDDPVLTKQIQEIRQHLLGWYVLQGLRDYYLVFMAHGCMPEEGVRLSAAVKDVSPSQAANILAAALPLVLTEAEHAHLTTFDIFLPPLPPDTLPPYLPPRPAHVKFCPALIHAGHYQQEQGLDGAAVGNRCGAAVGDAEEWLCGTQSVFR
ncbi:hypothetical protein JCM10207_000003 [Rhodosporidiobolus poonsookiae]